MRIAAGTRLAAYEILSPLGSGGMGEVYRARDTRLGREVAIKLVTERLMTDPDALARFEREARAVAALSHPNIVALHDVGHDNGIAFAVMELLDGQPLDRRLATEGLPWRTALEIAAAIADGLASAHSRGIIHRDLKPGNVFITRDGLVKIVDFGLATDDRFQFAPAGDNRDTAPGMVFGTLAYMSPEQVRGEPADHRTDIFSLGCVLYEMLGRHQPFRAETPAQVLAAILRDQPLALASLGGGIPPRAEALVRRCLEKDPDHRFQSARDLAFALREILNDSRETSTSPIAAGRPAAIGEPETLAPKSAADVTLEFDWENTLQAQPKGRTTGPADRSLVRLSVDLGPDAVPGLRTTAVLSPDGRRLAFLARGTDGIQRLATRLLEQAQPTLLAGTENAQDPFFSPNGEWLGFFADYKLKRVSVQGGSPVILCEAPNDRGASWADDDTIVVAPHIYGGLLRLPAGGGTPQPLTSPSEGEVAHAWPQTLPGGQAVLFTGGTFASPNVQVLSLATGQTKVVAAPGYHGRYLPSRHLVYVHQSTLFAVPFDIEMLEPRGVPVPVLDDVVDDAGDRTAHFAVACNGTLVYSSGKAVTSARAIAWMARSGKTEPLLETPGKYAHISLSPDGKLLAFVSGFPDEHIWVLDLQRGLPLRLTFANTGNIWPQWAADGQHLVFSAQNGRGVGRTLWWIRADGAGEPQRLLESSDELHPSSVSPDGGHVAIHHRTAETLYDILMLPLDASDPEHPRPGPPEVFLRTPVNEWGAVFSPNGQWVAYYSEQSGTGEIYVRPFRGPGGPWLVSSGSGISGSLAYWPRDGRALYYLSLDKRIMEVGYTERGNSFVPEAPRPWSDKPIPFASCTLSSDGDRAIIVVPVDPGTARRDLHVTFLLNFFDELRRRAPVGPKRPANVAAR